MPTTHTETLFDVAILGTGIGGTSLGAILAKNGLRVLLLEQTVHPRFAIGESTVPETTLSMRILAARYGVPELAHLSAFQRLRRHVGPSSGIKRNFSFAYHRTGEFQRPEESTQLSTFSPPLGPDVHFFRQDVDAYMLAVAASYGATVRQRTTALNVEFADDCVRVDTKETGTFRAKYLVDAGGIRSLLAQSMGLRQDPPTFRTRSRSMFTHMIGVLPYDAAGPSGHGLPSPLSQGTLHHLFDGGWMWVIPFDNHPTATNPLCSVGLNFDRDRHPPTGLAPEEEFWSFVRSHPSIARQFQVARPIREWTASDALQFSSTRAVGDRYCLLPHAFGFVDPLFSSGLGITMAAINLIASRLIAASKDGDFSAARFEVVDTWIKSNFSYYDRLVSNAYTAFSDFELWNAWSRQWMLASFYGGAFMLEVMGRFRRTGDLRDLGVGEHAPYRGVQATDLPEMVALFDSTARCVEAVRARTSSPAEAARNIFGLLEGSGIWPEPCGLGPTRRHMGDFAAASLLSIRRWARQSLPESVRKYSFESYGPSDLAIELARDGGGEVRHAVGRIATLARDSVVAQNSDWRSTRRVEPLALGEARAAQSVSGSSTSRPRADADSKTAVLVR